MDDSDDYIVDDIPLDDETLALLDQEEQKYLTIQKTSFADAPPVSKKRKTDSGWKPGLVHQWDHVDDFENLPEISVQADGTYGLHDNTISASNVFAVGTALGSTAAESERNALGVTTLTTVHSYSGGPDCGTQRRIMAEPHDKSSQQPPRSHARDPEHYQDDLFKQRLQDLQHDVQELKSELNQAIDARFTKEGEVTILRERLEKSAQEHAAQVSRLKAAKDEAIAKQIQIQKEMKEEIERIKTQFVFKQQEIESSRRAPPSARANRIYKDPLTTPIHRISQQVAGETPRPSRLFSLQDQPFSHQHPETPMLRRLRKSSSKTSGTSALPGFHNAFAKSPGRQRSDVSGLDNAAPSSPIAKSPASSPTRHLRTTPNGPSASAFELGQDQELVHPMISGTEPMIIEEDEDIQYMEDTMCRPVNWLSELSRIILTHAFPSCAQPTIQLMLATFGTPNEVDNVRFVEAGSEILRIIASMSVTQDFPIIVKHLCGPLVTMLHVLGKSNQYHTIQSLINLLTVLASSLPEFGTYLLSEAHNNSHSTCVDAIREIVVQHIRVTNGLQAPDSLAKEVLSFIEVACLHGQEDTMARLTPFLLDNEVWDTLLHNGQPQWLLTRICRLLVLFGSHRSLAQELLNIPNPPNTTEGLKPVEAADFLLLDRLSTFLCEVNEIPDPSQAMKEYILTFVAALSTACPDSLAMLINNDYLIPSLVCFLSNLTTLLWEEDGSLMSTPHAVAGVIRMVIQTVTLMHHLVFAADSCFNLRFRLHNPRRSLAGLHHMFIVSCGRLSYADAPEWVDKSGKHELEVLSDLARELLELVVDGPEIDNIWSLYQEDPEKNENEADEGEMEARLLAE